MLEGDVHIWVDKGNKGNAGFSREFKKKTGDSSSGKKWIGGLAMISADKFQRWQMNNDGFTGLWCDTEN